MTVLQQTRPVPAQKAPTSAVVGFVLAFLFWPAGLIVSMRALKRITLRGGGGRGLATAGVVVSAVVGATLVTWSAVSTVGAVRSETFSTDGESAACQLDVESANKALVAYNSTAGAHLTGTASAQLTALQQAGHVDSVVDIPGLSLDASGMFTGAC